jgi:acetate kinase
MQTGRRPEAGVGILVVNAGSSSLKVSVIDDADRLVRKVDLRAGDHDGLAAFIRSGCPPAAVGHRVVHGGPELSASVRIDSAVLHQLDLVTELAPLHNPPALTAIAVAREVLADVPQVACFDTAFHARLPDAAATYAIPREWSERWQIRRYGFHGLSHAYASRRTATLLARPRSSLRIVTCHLGAGASLCAVSDGRSLDTTMGFTPLEGLTMATRSGTVDPGLLLWLIRSGRLDPEELEAGLEHQSGLAGLAGVPDGAYEQVQQQADLGDPRARLALAVYQHRLRAGIGTMVASLGGIDALTFTGGVGEHSARLRAEVGVALGFLGVHIDEVRNRQPVAEDRVISASDARVATLVVHSREDLEIAREVRGILGRSEAP